MSHDIGYGWWGLALVNSLVFVLFAASFTKTPRGRDWRSLGAFSAFIVALFAEMYGFPLTVWLLAGWLGSHLPGFDLFAHDSGHLWFDLLGLQGDPHHHPIHHIANGLVLLGMGVVAWGWRHLFAAQREGRLATSGPYRLVRHPQYVGFVLVMVGFLVMWPTLPTALLFPVLLRVYARLARREENEVHSRFGEVWEAYARITPPFVPHLGRRSELPPERPSPPHVRTERRR